MDAEFNGNLNGYRPVKGTRFEADPADVREVARILVSAKRPIIHAGQGVLYAEAWNELKQLAELLQAPVMSTLSAKSVFPESHPLSLGTGSRTIPGHLHSFLMQADVVFGIGCSFTRTLFGVEIPSGKTTIHATNDPVDINKDYSIDCALLGDAKLVLAQLIQEVVRQARGSLPDIRRKTTEEVKAVKSEWLKRWLPKLTSDEVPINPYRVVWDMMHTVDRGNTIVTHDAGSPRDQMTPFYETTAPRTYIGWGKSTQLGYGLGLAMGAKMAAPGKLCINVMGDAAIGMVGMDFETAVRNRIPILTIVLNNGAMSIEVPTIPVATAKYGAKYMGGDYRQVAKALGGYGERVEKPADIVPALHRAVEVTKNGQPALLEFITKEEREFSSPD
jgi:acetolactate synthase-1/2/3 large subunit